MGFIDAGLARQARIIGAEDDNPVSFVGECARTRLAVCKYRTSPAENAMSVTICGDA